MVVGFTVPIITTVVSSNPTHGKVYSITLYVRHDITEILLKVALNTTSLTQILQISEYIYE